MKKLTIWLTYHDDKLISLCYLNVILKSQKINSYVAILRQSINIEYILNEFEYEANSINNGWLYCLFCLTIACEYGECDIMEKTKGRILATFYNDFVQLLDKQSFPLDITFMRGLSGIAFMYKVFPQMFVCTNKKK